MLTYMKYRYDGALMSQPSVYSGQLVWFSDWVIRLGNSTGINEG